jgi:ubiquinone/menaquinone biosynthesis C-methylase UbiE
MLQIARQWYYRLPLRWRMRFRKWVYLPLDLLSPPKDPAIPPRGINFTGPGDFEAIGKEFFAYFLKWGNISPDSHILEVGCGMGRMALPFKGYLSAEGRYTGIDIVPEGVQWCRDRIAPDDERYNFILADIQNDLYNPNGGTTAADYTFPLPDNSQHLVFLTSVFTHLLPDAVERYIREISRVLMPGGRMICTFFLLNDESRQCMATGSSLFRFQPMGAHYATIHTGLPESNMAYEEHWMMTLLERHDLQLVEPIQYGSWCGRKSFLSFQDVMIGEKN